MKKDKEKFYLKRHEIKGSLYPVLNKENWFVDDLNRVYTIRNNHYVWIANLLPNPENNFRIF